MLDAFKNKVFLKFLLSYILVLVIPVFINIKLLSTSLSLAKEQTIEFNQRQLKQLIERVDDIFSEVENLTKQVETHHSTLKLLNRKHPLAGEDYIEFNNLIGTVHSYAMLKDFFRYGNYYLFLENTEFIMTPHTLYSSNLYYQRFLSDKFASYEEFREFLTGEFHTGSIIHNISSNQYLGTSEDIIYMHSIPQLFYKKGGTGVFVVEINKSFIENMFEPLSLEERQGAYIIDEHGDIVMFVGDSYFFDPKELPFDTELGRMSGENFILTKGLSADTGWTYVVIMPESIVFEQIRHIQIFNIMLLVGSCIVGVVVAILFSKRNYTPILSMMTNNHMLMTDIKNQRPHLINSFIYNLISGKMYSATEINVRANYLSIDLKGDLFVAACIQLYNDDIDIHITEESIEELDIWKAIVKNTLFRYFGQSLIIHDQGKNTIALIFNLTIEKVSEEEFDSLAGKIFKEINAELQQTYNMGIYIGIGSYCSSISDIWRSFAHAELALHYKIMNKSVIFHKDIYALDDTYYYPPEYEQRFINLAKTGNYDELENALDILYKENFVDKSLSIESIKSLIVEIRSTLKKIQHNDGDENIKEKINAINTKIQSSENFDTIKNIYKDICQRNVNEKNKNNRKFIDKITAYINENYKDSDLGLYKISSNFNLSEGYFSYLFKEQMGVNFTEYLEKIRLDASIELLKNSNDTIDKIAQTVGYNSAQSYRRAFKKVHGCSPNIIRKEV